MNGRAHPGEYQNDERVREVFQSVTAPRMADQPINTAPIRSALAPYTLRAFIHLPF